MAISATPSNYSNLCTGTLAASITSTLATGITVTADTFKTPAGTGSVTWPTGNQIWKLTRKTRTNTQVEFIGVESLTQSGTALTTGTVIRYLSPTDGTSFTSQGNGLSFPAGTVVELVWDVRHAEHTAFKDNANTFTATQTISSTNKLQLNDSNTYIYDNGTDLILHDSNNSDITLSTLAAASGTDEKVKVSSNDTTRKYLEDALAAGAGISIATQNDGSNETSQISAVNTVATGHTGLSTVTSGGLLVGAGTSNMTIIGPGTTGQVPVSNGTTIAMGSAPSYVKSVFQSTTTSSGVGTSTTSQVDVPTHQYTIPANDLVSGVAYDFYFEGLINWGAGATSIRLKLGSTTITQWAVILTSSEYFVLRGKIMGTAAAGASVEVRGGGQLMTQTKFNGPSGVDAANVATNGTLVLKLNIDYNSSDGTNAFVVKHSEITRSSTTAS